mmetsp:Transcript_8336/g.1108  ORF Transcript_8336/g.1108 Transcript_8336/m.1108 type:complete len:195 (-) Transcript_8336:1629-2213(-)
MTLTARWAAATFASETDDRIILQFPTNYDLDRVKDSLTCDSDVLSETESDSCTVKTNRIEINAFSSTVDTTLVTSFTVDVNGIKNPSEEGNTFYIEFMIYDAGTKTILAKTLSNLNVIQSLSYEETDSKIDINFNQDIIINKGTRSDEIYVILEDDSAYNLEITANLPLGLTTDPSPIKINVGEYINSFILSCD